MGEANPDLAVIRRLRFGENYSPSRRIDFENFERDTYRMFGQGELHGTPLGPPTPEVALEASRAPPIMPDGAPTHTRDWPRKRQPPKGSCRSRSFRRACRSRSRAAASLAALPDLAPVTVRRPVTIGGMKSRTGSPAALCRRGS